jgi:hypothetical protein
MLRGSEIELRNRKESDSLVSSARHHWNFGQAHETPVSEDALRFARLAGSAWSAAASSTGWGCCSGLRRLDLDVIRTCNCALYERTLSVDISADRSELGD